MRRESARIITPWMSDVVDPPATLPRTIETLLVGVTMISLRNPNSRSQSTEIPANVAEKISAMPTMPGTRNWT